MIFGQVFVFIFFFIEIKRNENLEVVLFGESGFYV
jgi:hypothetical protein